MNVKPSIQSVSVEWTNYNKTTSQTLPITSYIYLVFGVFLAIVVIVGNVLLILSYASIKRLKTGTYTILVSLAVSDIFVGCFSLPLWIYGDLRQWNNINIAITDLFLSLDVLSAVASILHLTLVSIERFIAVSKPYYFHTLSKRSYFKVIAGIWIGSFILAAFEPVQRRMNWKRYYTALILIACFALPFVAMCFVYSYIFITTRRILRRSCGTDRVSKQRNASKEIRAAVTLAIITGLFVVAWLPFFTLTGLAVFCPESCLPRGETLLFLVSFAKLLHYCNSGCNPFVYAFRDRLVKEAFGRVIVVFLSKISIGLSTISSRTT